jgi:hypothetical protein
MKMQKRSRGLGIGTSATEPRAESVRFDADNMWVSLADGRKVGVPLAYFPRLLHATAKQRGQYVISGGGTGLHWDEIDEDISVRALVLGLGDRTNRGDRSRPEGRKASARR